MKKIALSLLLIASLSPFSVARQRMWNYIYATSAADFAKMPRAQQDEYVQRQVRSILEYLLLPTKDDGASLLSQDRESFRALANQIRAYFFRPGYGRGDGQRAFDPDAVATASQMITRYALEYPGEANKPGSAVFIPQFAKVFGTEAAPLAEKGALERMMTMSDEEQEGYIRQYWRTHGRS